jgi:hypothetical protein
MKRSRLLPLSALLLTSATLAQQPAPPTPAPTATSAAMAPAPSDETPSQPGHYVGVASCANSGCHGSTQPLKEARVLQNEYYTWLNSDRHAGAYNVLFNDRSARIVRNMHLKGKAYAETLCLDCHSTNVAAGLVSGRIDREDGVQCEACHGPAGGWRAEHTQLGWTHEQSVARGLTDLRALPTRATVCLACHLGNGSKEVDHELIASGHPLLAFELDNYSETMPAHWQPHKESHGVPAWVTGQAMSFRESMRNLSHHAHGEKWPEFSDMSCTNCHHALESGQWRQERGWPGRAGLPAWSPQRWAVLRLIVARAAPSAAADLDSAVQQVASRVSRMSDPAGVAAAADNARRLLDNAMPKINAAHWSDADIRAFMRTLAADEDFIRRSDVQSAEQLALSLQSLSAALTRSDARLLKSPMTAAIDALFAELQNRDRYDPNRFADKLRALREAL